MNVKLNGVPLVLGHAIRNRSGSSSGFEDQQQIHLPKMVSFMWKLRLHLGVSADDMKKELPAGNTGRKQVLPKPGSGFLVN